MSSWPFKDNLDQPKLEWVHNPEYNFFLPRLQPSKQERSAPFYNVPNSCQKQRSANYTAVTHICTLPTKGSLCSFTDFKLAVSYKVAISQASSTRTVQQNKSRGKKAPGAQVYSQYNHCSITTLNPATDRLCIPCIPVYVLQLFSSYRQRNLCAKLETKGLFYACNNGC